MKFADKPSNKRTVFASNAQLEVQKVQKPDSTEPVVTLVGYPIVWNAVSDDRGGFKVRLMPASAVFADEVQALYNHNTDDVLGTTSNNTLRISQDNIGVKVEIDVAPTTCGEDVAILVERQDVKGMSFSMAFGIEDGEQVEEDGSTIINASKYTVDEVSICGRPAFTETAIVATDSSYKDDETEDQEFKDDETEDQEFNDPDSDDDDDETEDGEYSRNLNELELYKLKEYAMVGQSI